MCVRLAVDDVDTVTDVLPVIEALKARMLNGLSILEYLVLVRKVVSYDGMSKRATANNDCYSPNKG